jgi:hypothetical protein
MPEYKLEQFSLDDDRGKYTGLARLLEDESGDYVTLSFAEIEAALGFRLPPSAGRYPAWWSNTEKGHTHARAWLRTGWRTGHVSVSGQRVSFSRVTSVARRPGVAARSSAPRTSGSERSVDHRVSTLAPQTPWGEEDRKNRIGLVGCVKKKQSRPAPAEDLYTSPLFRGRRAYVERTCERWLILSALHGVVRPDAVLEPYNVTLNDASQAERRSWATKVLRQLDAELGTCAGLTFEIHAGSNYADYGLESGLRARSAAVDRPTFGLSMGRQLSFYADADRDAADVSGIIEPAPDDAAPLPSAPEWDERDAWSAVADLDESPELVRIRDWPGDLACLDGPGLYAWWVDAAGAAALARGLGMHVSSGRIYAGQAGATKWPSGKAGNNTLGKRIGQMHLGGKVRMSTFRWTLASILFEELGVQVQASMLISPASEEALSEWMRAHLSVAVHPHDDRDTLEGLERELLGRLDPPLNLRHMAATPLRVRLTDLRRRISREP